MAQEIKNKKYYYKEGTTAQINAYLKRLGLGGFGLDDELMEIQKVSIDYYDYDGVTDAGTHGASISYGHHDNKYEVYVTKYDIVGN